MSLFHKSEFVHLIKSIFDGYFRVTEKKSKNMMGAENLAIVFAPTVMRSPDSDPMASLLSVGKEQKSMELLIVYYKELFLK